MTKNCELSKLDKKKAYKKCNLISVQLIEVNRPRISLCETGSNLCYSAKTLFERCTICIPFVLGEMDGDDCDHY